VADYDTLPGANNAETTFPARVLTPAARVHLLTAEISLETGELGTSKFYFPYAARILGTRVQVTKALAGTDSATLTLQNAAAANITPNAVMTLAASSPAFTTEENNSQTSTTNNLIAAGSFCQVVAAKATPGGRVRYTIEWEPQ